MTFNSSPSLEVVSRGGKRFFYYHFRGAKALFCYENHQTNGSAGGKTMLNFSFGGNAPCVPPAGTCLIQF